MEKNYSSSPAQEEPIEVEIFMRYGTTTDKAEGAIQAYQGRLLIGLTPDEALAYVDATFSQHSPPTTDSDFLPDPAPEQPSS